MNDGMNLDDAVIVALGSNRALGAAGPQQILESALTRFPAFGMEVVKRSRWWRSKAWPEGAGPDFVNGIALVRTTLGPEATLEALHAIEREFGRERNAPNAPRTLDLDLIAYGRLTTPLPRGERGRGEGVSAELTNGTPLGAAPNSGSAFNSQEPPPTQPFPLRGARAWLPHPRAHERLFVMGPLGEIAPGWRHPVSGLTASDLAARAKIGADARPI